MEKYDVAIIGGGIGGLITAYGLLKQNQEIRIAIFEKGCRLSERKCPIVNNKVEKCANCKICSIMNGVAGAGAFSDGKFIISTEYGGHLQDYIGEKLAQEYMQKLDIILMEFGAPTKSFSPNNTLIELCKKNGLNIKTGIVKHFGTENNIHIMNELIRWIETRCTIFSQCAITEVEPDTHLIYRESNNSPVFATHIVFAVGRSGSKFFSDWCHGHCITIENHNVDIGVRVELKAETWQSIAEIAYDPKISYTSKHYKDETRVFCFNDSGYVVLENTFGAKTVNGHAYQDLKLKTENSNFALLTSIKLTEPFNNPIEYINLIAKNVNCISGGTAIIQRFGDLIRGVRTTEEKLYESSIKPTLTQAYPGDLSLCIPKRQLDSIIETIYQLDKIAPGTAGEDTLLYGIEGKYYSAVPRANNLEIENCENIYACGDGCGITRSLAQAGANGLYLADRILTA